MEEDRKRAEEEGMAFKSRKDKAEDLTITISKSTSVSSLKMCQPEYFLILETVRRRPSLTCLKQDNRVVMTKLFSGSPESKCQQEAGPDGEDESPQHGAGRGHRKQLTVTMAGKKVCTLCYKLRLRCGVIN